MWLTNGVMISKTSGNLARVTEFNGKWDSLGLVVGVEADDVTKFDIQKAMSKSSKKTIQNICQNGVDRDGTPLIDVALFTRICREKAEDFLRRTENALPEVEFEKFSPSKNYSPPKSANKSKSPIKVNTTPLKVGNSPGKQETPTPTSHVSESYISHSPFDEEVEFVADDDEDADTYQNKVFLNHTSLREHNIKHSPLVKSPQSNNSFSFHSKSDKNNSVDKRANSQGSQQFKRAASEWVLEQMKEHFDSDAVEKLRRTLTTYANERRKPPKLVSFKSMSEVQVIELKDVVEDIIRNVVRKSDGLRRVQVAFMFVEPSDEVLMGVRNSKISITPKKWLTIKDVQEGFLAGRLLLNDLQAYTLMKLVSDFAKETQAPGFSLEKEEVKLYSKGKLTGNVSRIALAKGQKLNAEWLKKYLIHLKITKRTKPTRFFLGSAQPEPKVTAEEDNEWDIYLKKSRETSSSKRMKTIVYNHVSLTDESAGTKAMSHIPSAFLSVVKGKPHSFTTEDINHILGKNNILDASFIRLEIFRRVDAWVIDYDGRKSFQHGINVAYSKWLKTHSAPISPKEKQAVFETLKKELVVLKTEELISSERINKAITKDLFWKYDKYMHLLNYSKSITWNTWLDNHSTKMEELLVKSRALSRNLKFDATKMVAASSLDAKSPPKQGKVSSRTSTPVKSSAMRRSTGAVPRLVTDHAADSDLIRKSLSALEKAALEASNIGNSTEDFDKHLRGVLIPHLKQLEAEVRKENELFTSRSLPARKSDTDGNTIINKKKTSFEDWKKSKDAMRLEILSKQKSMEQDKEKEVERKKILGQERYEEWLDSYKRGQYKSKSKGELVSIPKQLISVHEEPFDTVRKTKKVAKKENELVEIDLTVQGIKLNTET